MSGVPRVTALGSHRLSATLPLLQDFLKIVGQPLPFPPDPRKTMLALDLGLDSGDQVALNYLDQAGCDVLSPTDDLQIRGAILLFNSLDRDTLEELKPDVSCLQSKPTHTRFLLVDCAPLEQVPNGTAGSTSEEINKFILQSGITLPMITLHQTRPASFVVPFDALATELLKGKIAVAAKKKLITIPGSESGMLALSRSKGTYAHVPLCGVHVEARIVDFVAHVVVTQRYLNDGMSPLECKYCFPLEEHAAVCEFEAFINGKHIIGVVQSKKQARETYDDAIASGQGAYLLEQTAPDVFTMTVGNLPPSQEVLIRITYVVELRLDEISGSLLFSLPTTIAPRKYQEPNNNDPNNQNSQIVSEYASQVPYGLTLQLELNMPSFIEQVQSETHRIIVERPEDVGNKFSATVKFATKERMDRDFLMQIRLREPHSPRVWIEQHSSSSSSKSDCVLDVDEPQNHAVRPASSSKAVMLAFYPRFEFQQVNSEFIFLVDRSGSMGGNPIRQASQTMQAILERLSGIGTSTFNIIGFGSQFDSLFKGNSVEVNPPNITTAIQYCSSMTADLGGTNLLAPLHFIFNHMDHQKSHAVQLFVLTDGEVENTASVIATVRANAHIARVFTFGIGSSVSKSLVDGMARAGHGKAEYIVSSADDFKGKVFNQFQRSLQPALTNVTLDWPSNTAFKQAPIKLPPMFNLDRYLVYAFVSPDCSLVGRHTVTLKATSPDGPVQLGLTVDLDSPAISGKTIHRLAAKTLIKELEESSQDHSDELVAQIVELGTKFGLVSNYTSFVAIEQRDEPTLAAMNSVTVPTLAPAQNEELAADLSPQFLKSSCLSVDSSAGGGDMYAQKSRRYARKAGCFIATAAYGSSMDPRLEILRNFRDQTLEHSVLGRKFVDLYYDTSPPVAEFISTRTWLRFLVRCGLLPVLLVLGLFNRFSRNRHANERSRHDEPHKEDDWIEMAISVFRLAAPVLVGLLLVLVTTVLFGAQSPT